MMTRKDYVATAEILNDLYLDLPIKHQELFERTVNQFAEMFKADNDRFLADRFYNACYAEE